MPRGPLFAFFVILGLLAWFLVDSNLKIRERRSQVAKKLSEVQTALASQQEQRRRYLGALGQRDDPLYLEREARQRFNLKKPGEQVVVIVGEKPASAETQPPLLPQVSTWWQRIAAWLGF